jgi:hypothetical protein
MRKTGALRHAARRALLPTMLVGTCVLLFGAIDVMRRGTRPAVAIVIGLGLAGVVFVTYFSLGIARRRVGGDGTVEASRTFAWLVVLTVVLAIGALAVLTLRSLPHGWR